MLYTKYKSLFKFGCEHEYICHSTEEITTALKVGNGNSIIYIESGTYTAPKGGWSITNTVENIEIKPIGGKVILRPYSTTDTSDCVFRIDSDSPVGKNRVKISDINFSSTGKACLIGCHHIDNLIIENCTFSYVTSCLYLGHATNALISNNVFISAKTYESSSYAAIAFYAIDSNGTSSNYPLRVEAASSGANSYSCNVNIQGNTFDTISGYGIMDYPNTGSSGEMTVKHINISNNNFYKCRLCIGINAMSHVTIGNNTAETCINFLYLNNGSTAKCKNITVTGNTFDGTDNANAWTSLSEGRFVFGAPMTAADAINNITITGNDIINTFRHAIGLTCNFSIISNNNIYKCGGNGIYLYGGNNISCVGNNIVSYGLLGSGFYGIKVGGNGNYQTTRAMVSSNKCDEGYIRIESNAVNTAVLCNQAIINDAGTNTQKSGNVSP